MSKLSPLFKLRNYVLDFESDNKKHFLGQVLTIIDATIVDKEQRKAIKDLIHDKYWEENYGRNCIRFILEDFAKNYCKKEVLEDFDRDGFLGQENPGKCEESEPDYWSN